MRSNGAVLVVDDDELWVRACERGFRGMGRAVHAAASIDGALAIVAEHHPELVVADVRLGCESGLELIEPVRRREPGCTIVVASAYLSVAITAAAVQRGADLVLFKPIHPSEIIRQVTATTGPAPSWETPTLARAEWEHICRVLADCDGNISEAARRLGILRQSLQRKLRKHAPAH